MRSLSEWFSEYEESHQHPTNKLIHYICVPLIMFSLLGLLYAAHPLLCVVFCLGCLVFYSKLSKKLAVWMTAVTAFMLCIMIPLDYLWQISLVLFGGAWVFQFIGHSIEGKKPSFAKDVQFLLIGPLWVLDHFLTKLSFSPKIQKKS